MAQTAGPRDQLPDELGRLASDTTELGIVVGDMFRYACAGLFGQEPETARFVTESQAWVAQAVIALDRRARRIIQVYQPIGDEMRRIAELQHATSEYRGIAERSSKIAEHALRLGGASDEVLAQVAPNASTLMYTLISLVYEQMRGVFLVTAARDTAQARRLVASDAEVEAYYAALRVRLQYRIKHESQAVVPLHLTLMVARRMREIGEAVVEICKATL